MAKAKKQDIPAAKIIHGYGALGSERRSPVRQSLDEVLTGTRRQKKVKPTSKSGSAGDGLPPAPRIVGIGSFWEDCWKPPSKPGAREET
jgi:hypothetical protein